MKVIETTPAFIEWRKSVPSSKTVGFVPTMGALHAGHVSLITQARQECDIVVSSLFVNPTQFNNPDDLKNYPRTWEDDHRLLKEHGTDVVFLPQKADLYPDEYRYKVTENDLSNKYCGAHRPGHFDGVLSVVMKLFQLTRPQFAYFGEKDFQQLRLIEGMVDAFFLPIKIHRGKTIRENDGLAMSSRNRRLTTEQRQRAPLFFKILKDSETPQIAIERLQNEGFKVDYVEDWDRRRLGAVFLGDVRLIDNVEL